MMLRGRILACVFALALAAAALLPAHAAETIRVRAAEHDKAGFGRIAFDWQTPVAFDAKIEGETLTVHFARPFAADLAAVTRDLDRYVGAIHMEEDGATLVATLKRPATLHSFTDGNTVAIDIIAAPPQGTPPKAEAAAVPAAPQAGAAQPVGLRFGEHRGYRRVVFDWHGSVPYRLSEQDGTAQLRFGRAGTLDLARLQRALPDLSPAVQQQDGATIVSFSLPAGTRLRDLRSGNSIVLDVLGGAAPEAARSGTIHVTPPPELIEPSAGMEGEKPPLGAPRPLTRPTSQASPPPGSLLVHYALAPQGASLRFDWPQPSPAAVFRRGAALWIVFAEAKPLDLTELRRASGDIIERADQLPDNDATVLRLVARPGINPSLRRTGDAWIVELRPQEARAEAPIPVDVRAAAETPDVLFDLAGAGKPLWLRDPEIGDTLAVVPTSELGHGVAQEQDLVDFTALATVQGIVLRPNADDLRVTDTANGVAVTRPHGLLLSPPTDRQLAQQPGALGRLFDFAAWKGPPGLTFLQERSRLEQAIAAAPASFRSKPRLALARFYFAYLFAPEAAGVLEAIERDDPTLAADPPVRLMTGAVHLMMGDEKRAAEELGQPSLDNEPEALLWRASLSAELGDWKVAAHGFALSSNLLPRYPQKLRDRFALQAADAFLETGQPAEAQAMTELVLKSNPPKGDKGMALYFDGKRALAQGDFNHAIDLWNQVVQVDDRPSRARALYARTMAEFGAKKIDRPEAVKELDKLRFAWRGDGFEFNLLREIGELKLADGDQAGGFDALREAGTDFPDYPQSKDVLQELSDGLADVFLGKGAESVPPLKALTLYDEFKDYAPVGEHGDAIVRRLVDRLVAVDLLDRAADLLQDEVTHRLVGRDKARVAAQLALIRLLDNDPADAVKALDIDVGKDVPPELQRQRQQLRARALAQLGHTDEALAILASDTSRDADRLRADIYWRTQNWPEAAKVFARLVPPPGADGTIDKPSSQLVLNWASALTLAGDQAGLEKLRETYGKAMAATSLADAFRVVAGDSPATGSTADDPRSIASRVAELGELQSFMASYKERLAKDKLSAIN
ncbi:MAG TPA: tetratricopeptide repeat protein [Stellaceae bacterium]|nr:tetratricopeptide repeat protein [Stellaceae bacterium]